MYMFVNVKGRGTLQFVWARTCKQNGCGKGNSKWLTIISFVDVRVK